MGRDTLGDFEKLVLLACLRLGSQAYTVAVVDEIKARTGREPSHSAVYVALRRMESKGLVRSTMGAPTAERGGRPKRFFTVEPAARTALRVAREELTSMWDGIEGAV